MSGTRSLLSAALLTAACAGGCVSSGPVDVNYVTRYQESLAARGAQDRGKEGAEPMTPGKTAAGPELATQQPQVVGEIRVAQAHRIVKDTEGKPLRDEQGRMSVRLVRIERQFDRDPNKAGALTVRAEDEAEYELGTAQVKTLDELPKEFRLDADTVGPEQMELVEPIRVASGSGERLYSSSAVGVVPLTLDEAIMRALANSLEIRVVSFDPAISREEMIQAAAAFDAVLVGGLKMNKQDNMPASSLVGSQNKVMQYSLGVKQHTLTGADYSLQYALTRTWDDSPFDDPGLRTRWEPTLVMQVTQPLLRDFGPAVNLAKLRVARLNKKVSDQQFRDRVEQIVNQVIGNYWFLTQARRNYRIQQSLLRSTLLTYRTVYGRRRGDAAMVVIKQAEASVKIREAALIRARRGIFDAQDRMVKLLADPQLNLLAKIEVVPATPLAEQPIRLDNAEQLLIALRNNPVLEQARLGISVAQVSVDVARNQLLPRLDLQATAGIQGLAHSVENANEVMFNGDFASYGLQLTFEVPIGNRERCALLRQRQFEKTKSIVQLQELADQVSVAVNQSVRQVELAYLELLAQRDAVRASRDQLTGLKARWDIVEKTPEFTRTLLAAQETLAGTEAAELQSVIDFNTALADLARATGVVLSTHGVKVDMEKLSESLRQGVVPTTQPACCPKTVEMPCTIVE